MKNRRMAVFCKYHNNISNHISFKYNQEQKKQNANEKLNKNFYEVRDYGRCKMLLLKMLLKKRIYLKKDLEYSNSRFFAYLRSV